MKKSPILKAYKTIRKDEHTEEREVETTDKPQVESLKDLKNCYVMPFDINLQYLFHLFLNMKVEDALLLAWSKYEALLTLEGAAQNLKKEYMIPNVEVASITAGMKSTIRDTAMYVGELDEKNHPSLAPRLGSVNVAVNMKFDEVKILDKCVPTYETRKGLSLGVLSELLKDIAPYLGIIHGLTGCSYNKAYLAFYQSVERVHNVTLTPHERKMVYDRTFKGFNTTVVADSISRGVTRVDHMINLLSTMKVEKVQVFAQERGVEASVVVNVVVATMINEDIAAIIPHGVYVGVMKLARRFTAGGMTDILKENEDLDIVCAYCYAKIVLKELSEVDGKGFNLTRKFGTIAGQAVCKMAETVIVPILKTHKITMKVNMLLIK
jgi:hypothetical protein